MSLIQPHYIPKMFESACQAEEAVADWGWFSRRYGSEFVRYTKGHDKSIAVLAKQSGLSSTNLSMIIKGNRFLTPEAFLKIVEAANMYDYNRAIHAHRIQVKKLEDT